MDPAIPTHCQNIPGVLAKLPAIPFHITTCCKKCQKYFIASCNSEDADTVVQSNNYFHLQAIIHIQQMKGSTKNLEYVDSDRHLNQ